MPELLTLAQAKAYLNLRTDTHDAEVQGCIDAAVEAIERYLGQVVAPRTVSELHDLRHSAGVFVLRRHPVTALISVTGPMGGDTSDLALLDLEPDTGIVRVLAGAGPGGRVRVTYLAGPPVPSAAHQRAAEIIVGNLFEAQRIAGAGPATSAASADEQIVTDAYGVAIPPRARELLGPPAPLVG